MVAVLTLFMLVALHEHSYACNWVLLIRYIQDAQTIKMLTEMMYVIAQHVDYSSLTSANSFILGHTVSPDRRRQHTVLAGNLQKFVLLLTEVLVWMNSPGNLSSAVRKEVSSVIEFLFNVCFIVYV